jgi:glycerol-3-phosphate dehydrogenase (NAD(P)+)
MPATITVLGAGSWGTALAVHLSRVGHDVRLWARDPTIVDDMRARRANVVYLPDVTLPATVHVTHDLSGALAGAALVICAVPSHGCRAVLRHAAPHLGRDATIVSATKGLERDSHLRVSQVIAEEVGPAHPVVVLSGPSFAREVAQQLPTAVLAASVDGAATELVQREFRDFPPVMAATMWWGRDRRCHEERDRHCRRWWKGWGSGFALAALITRGLAEITRLA